MVQKVSSRKNQSVHQVLLRVINSIIDNHGSLFDHKEWNLALHISGASMEFLSLQGPINPDDSDSMFDIIHKVKNMFLNRLGEDNMKRFIQICDA